MTTRKGGYGIKTVKCDLARDLDHVNLHGLADLHIGDANCNEALIRRRVQAVADDPHGYIILNGDLLNTATRQSPSDIFTERMTPTEQLVHARDLFAPVKDRIVAITSGNHENRAWRSDGVDLTRLLAIELGIEDAYAPEGVLVFLRFGAMSKNDKDGSGQTRMICYTIYATHGSGGGRKEGAKANRLADLDEIVDADIYLHSHTHMPMITKRPYYRTNQSASTASAVERLYVNTGATLTYGGYAQASGFKPASMETPVIWLSGVRKQAMAKL